MGTPYRGGPYNSSLGEKKIPSDGGFCLEWFFVDYFLDHRSDDIMSSLWNAKKQDPLVEAQNSGSTITLTCCLSRKGEAVEMRIEGLLRNVQGREAQVFVQRVTTLSGKNKDPDDHFEFSFQIAASHGENQGTRMGARGIGLILKTEDNKDGTLRTLDLRFPHNYTVRPLRKNKRYVWNNEHTRLLSVLLIDKPPSTREELATLLRTQQKDSLLASQLIDISAGGACICLPEEVARPSFSTGALYIVFFIPSLATKSDFPFVFLAKRLGLGREQCLHGTAVRLCFTDELNWTYHHQLLKWTPIELDGSTRLRDCLLLYNNDNSLTP